MYNILYVIYVTDGFIGWLVIRPPISIFFISLTHVSNERKTIKGSKYYSLLKLV